MDGYVNRWKAIDEQISRGRERDGWGIAVARNMDECIG